MTHSSPMAMRRRASRLYLVLAVVLLRPVLASWQATLLDDPERPAAAAEHDAGNRQHASDHVWVRTEDASLRALAGMKDNQALHLKLKEIKMSETIVIRASNIVIQGERGGSRLHCPEIGSALHFEGTNVTLIHLHIGNCADGRAMSVGSIVSDPNARCPRHLDGTENEDHELKHYVTVKHCHFNNNKGSFHGAGIAVADTQLIIRDSVFRDNIANRGAAITALKSVVKIKRSTFTSTHISAVCGIIAPVKTKLTIQDSSFKHNNAAIGGVLSTHHAVVDISSSLFLNNSANEGGAIMLNQTSYLTIHNSVFLNNSANVGGSIFADDNSTMEIEGSTFQNNHADIVGGSIYVGRLSRLKLDNSTVQRSSAGSGGAIGARGSEVDISNSNLKGNSAESNGGALYGNESVAYTVDNSRLKNNVADHGGAVSLTDHSSLSIRDSFFRRNSASLGGSVYTHCSAACIADKTIQAIDEKPRCDAKGCRVMLANIRFISGSAMESGGALYFVNANVSVKSCQFIDNAAGTEETDVGLRKVPQPTRSLSVPSEGNTAVDISARKQLSKLITTTDPSSRLELNERGGGAIAVRAAAVLEMEKCVLKRNLGDYGGALSIDGQTDEMSVLMEDCTFESNRAVVGGAIHARGDGFQLHLANTHLRDNSADTHPNIYQSDSVKITVSW